MKGTEEKKVTDESTSKEGAVMKVTVDKNLCQGYALCMMEAPEVFDLDEDTDKAVVLQASPSEDLRAKVETAVRNCPTRAITLEES